MKIFDRPAVLLILTLQSFDLSFYIEDRGLAYTDFASAFSKPSSPKTVASRNHFLPSFRLTQDLIIIAPGVDTGERYFN